MTERFYSPEPITGSVVELAGAEAHHLLHVMRAAVGDRVIIFDGRGGQCDATIEECRRSSVVLAVGERRTVSRETSQPIVLAVALPKGDRQRWLVEKAVELGVARLVPLETARGSVRAGAATIRKLERTVIEASKQCGRNKLMTIDAPTSWEDFLHEAEIGSPGGGGETRLPLMAHPGGQPFAETLLSGARPSILAVGPEGGWTDAEIAAGQRAAWTIVDLGPRILRVESAAILIAGVAALWHCTEET